jgi:hypothetical protein
MFNSSEIYLNAKNYIQYNARPLDKALFLYEFEKVGSHNQIIKALQMFQNRDGGFGHALEPDIRMPQSSPLATTVAFQYLNNIKANLPEDLIKSALNYFIQTVQTFPGNSPIKYYWNSTSPDVNMYPHAPWWNTENSEPPKLSEWSNPNAEIIGILIQYSKYVPKDLIKDLINDLNTYIDLNPSLTGFIFYKYLNFKRILPHVSKNIQDKIFNLLDNTFKDAKLLNEDVLKEVKIQLLVSEKTSYLYQKYPNEIEKLLQLEISNIDEDGGSHPGWKWGDNKLWKAVEKEWTGKLTFDLLATLKYTEFLEK